MYAHNSLVSFVSGAVGTVNGKIVDHGKRFVTVEVTVSGNKFYRKGHRFMILADSPALMLR